MKESVSPAKSALLYGCIFGFIMVAELLILYKLQPDPLKYGWVGILSYLCNLIFFPLSLITLGSIAFRKRNGGYISVPQTLKTGLTVTLVGALIYVAFYFIFVTTVPQYIDNSVAQIKFLKVHNEPNLAADKLNKFLIDYRSGMQPGVTIPIVIIVYTFIGMVGSFIIGAFVKRDNPAAA